MQNSDTITVRHGKFYVERGSDPFVRIPSELFKGIAYIGAVAAKDASGRVQGDIFGTGFFVKKSIEQEKPLSYIYLVTAKHVVKDIGKSEPYIVANGSDGSLRQLVHLGPQWWYHPSDESADVAVRQVGFQPDLLNFAADVKDFIFPNDVKSGVVVPGDETFTAGYFSPISSDRMIPIVRHGNIAMLPDEQIQTNQGYRDVYLVEARSIGGISGSPVFVRPPLRYGIEMPKGTTAMFDAIGHYKLLGVMHGHWDIDESKKNETQIEPNKHGVNMGIGIVVPAIKIIETIMQPGLEELRKKADAERARQYAPTMDSAKKHDDPDRTFTKQDFENALEKASRKLSD
jgi:hypothetical protein